MAFPKSKIIPAKKLVQQIIESNNNGERFCFILGSGASVESKIPSGSTLEMTWMNCIMGESADMETPPMDADFMRQYATNLHDEGLIQHSFEEIENAWRNAKRDIKAIPSKYYFDIYKLRFSPNPRNGYRYLERLMEACEPSLGYHTLALMLSENDKNNLVITTNFDSLVEDALFLYTDKKPLVVSHESLAGYIESDIRRPIIAKVHRGLMYAPFNSPETTQELKKEWREALDYAFSTYTPIVVGYGGGDHSLMTYLEESTSMRHGIYWCYREVSGLPDETIQNFVKGKNGCFVTISGFDALMMEIGTSLYKKDITPSRTEELLQNQCKQRVDRYNEQWEKLNKNLGLGSILQPINDAEKQEEEKRKKNNALTVWDYIRQGNRAVDENQYEEALKAYTQAIEMDNDNAIAYNNRGVTYKNLKQYEKAFEDYLKAIELGPNDADAYNNRGSAYGDLEQYEKAIEDFLKAIELNPNYAYAYYNMGIAYKKLKQHEKAIENYSKAIELDPKFKVAYLNRAEAYRALDKVALAETDEATAKKL